MRIMVPGSREAHVLLEVYDSAGRLLKTLVNEEKEPGYHLAGWNCEDKSGKEAAAGVYFYRLTAGSVHTSTKKMILLR